MKGGDENIMRDILQKNGNTGAVALVRKSMILGPSGLGEKYLSDNNWGVK